MAYLRGEPRSSRKEVKELTWEKDKIRTILKVYYCYGQLKLKLSRETLRYCGVWYSLSPYKGLGNLTHLCTNVSPHWSGKIYRSTSAMAFLVCPECNVSRNQLLIMQRSKEEILHVKMCLSWLHLSSEKVNRERSK